MRDVVVQGPRDGDDEIDARKTREEERGLHGEVGARGGAGGEDVGCVGLGEEAVGRGDGVVRQRSTGL